MKNQKIKRVLLTQTPHSLMSRFQRHIVFLAAGLLFFACYSKKVSNTGCWVNKARISNKYKNIYVLGMLRSSYSNISVESEMAAMALERGIITTRNYDVQPASEVTMEMRKDLALMKIKQYECDAICTIGVKDVRSESHYSGGTSLSVSGYMPYSSYGGYYNQFPSYYANYYQYGGMGGYYSSGTVELSPGKITTEKTYFVECNLFDAATYELLFSIQSKAFNPKDIDKVSKEYCAAIFKTLEKEGVIKQKVAKK
jgi:hypothetical protein